jgi:hypothetical protein
VRSPQQLLTMELVDRLVAGARRADGDHVQQRSACHSQDSEQFACSRREAIQVLDQRSLQRQRQPSTRASLSAELEQQVRTALGLLRDTLGDVRQIGFEQSIRQ